MARVEKVRIKPAADKRKEFSKWAVKNNVRMITHIEFHVPITLLPDLPEELLIGASVDSQLYIPSSRFEVKAGGVLESTTPSVEKPVDPPKSVQKPAPVPAFVKAPEPPAPVVEPEPTPQPEPQPKAAEPAIVEATEPAEEPAPAASTGFACDQCEPVKIFPDAKGLAIHNAHKHKSE